MKDLPSEDLPRVPQPQPFKAAEQAPAPGPPFRTRHGATVDWSVFNALPIRVN